MQAVVKFTDLRPEFQEFHAKAAYRGFKRAGVEMTEQALAEAYGKWEPKYKVFIMIFREGELFFPSPVEPVELADYEEPWRGAA